MINAMMTFSFSGSSALNSLGNNNAQGLSSALGGLGAGGGMVDMLADVLTQALFEKKGDGATFNNSGDNPLMDMVAGFMDQHRSQYNGPDDAFGGVRNWKDEMSEDNYLDGNEFKEFKQGLKDALGSVLGGGLSQVMGTLGNAFGGGGFGSTSFGGSGMSGFGSFSFGLSGSAGGQDMFAFGSMSLMGQSGFAMGGNFASHVGSTALDGIDIQKHHGRFSFGAEDKDIAKDIGKFMDHHTEKFGEPPRGGWANRIEKGKDFNSEEIGQFKDAVSALKGLMVGHSMGDFQIDMDGIMLSNSIMNDAMYKLS